MAFRNYVLWRRGTLPSNSLKTLSAPRTLALVDRIEDLDAEREQLGAKLGDALFAHVPELDTGTRRAVLRLRRDLHNDRVPAKRVVDAVSPILSSQQATTLRRWMDAHERRRDYVAKSDLALTEELATARLGLAALLDGDLLDGILLTGPDVFNSVVSYRAAVTESRGETPAKQLRKAEKTALAYLCRTICKPTPFGSFTEVGAQPWTAVAAGDGHRVRRARLNRGLLAWMTGLLQNVEGSDHAVRIRLNDTVAFENGKAVFFRRGRDGHPDGFAGETFSAIDLSPVIRFVVKTVGTGVITRGGLIDLIRQHHGVSDDAARAFVDRVVQCGFLLASFGIPDQEPRPAGMMAELLRENGTSSAREFAGTFDLFQRIEDEFPSADTGRRVRLLAELDRERRNFASATVGNTGLATLSNGRALLFEDVGRNEASPGWDGEVVHRLSPEFALLGHLLPVIDDSTFVRLGLYRHFVSTHDDKDGPVGLLDYYREITALGAPAVSTIMTATGDPTAALVRTKRNELLDRLRILASGGDHADLGSRWVRRFVADLPAPVTGPGSFAARIQFVRGHGTPGVILNETMSGRGVFFSRFCDLLRPSAPDAWSVAGAVRQSILEHHPRQTDLTAVLGLNISLHPDLTPIELLYPGSIRMPGRTGSAHTLRDVTIEPDHDAQRLVLRSVIDGRPLDLLPMSFLFPAAGPLLYRFLCAFAPIHAVRRGWWNRVREFGRFHRFPRLTLGDLILDRRTWHVPANAVPAVKNAETIDGLLALRRWQHDLGVDDECFFTAAKPHHGGERDWISETQRWAREANHARLSKRHFLDFRSPLLLNTFLRQAPADGAGLIVLEEALPAPESGSHAPDSWGAEEYLIEFADDPADRTA